MVAEVGSGNRKRQPKASPGKPRRFHRKPESWPALPLEAWQDTYSTLHMWTQIVGKVVWRRAP